MTGAIRGRSLEYKDHPFEFKNDKSDRFKNLNME